MAISPWRCSTSPKWDVTSVCKAYEGVKKLLSKLPKVCAHYFTEGNLTVNIKKGLKQLYSICENLAKEETEGNNWTNVQRRSRAHTGEQMRWSLQAVEPVTTLPTEGIYFKPGSQSPADPSEDTLNFSSEFFQWWLTESCLIGSSSIYSWSRLIELRYRNFQWPCFPKVS